MTRMTPLAVALTLLCASVALSSGPERLPRGSRETPRIVEPQNSRRDAVSSDFGHQQRWAGTSTTNRTRTFKGAGPSLRPHASPEDVWAAMKANLSAGNVEAALLLFTARTREKHRALFGALGPNLPQFARDFRSITRDYVDEGTARYMLVQRDETIGRDVTYPVYFDKDENGEWRIREF